MAFKPWSQGPCPLQHMVLIIANKINIITQITSNFKTNDTMKRKQSCIHSYFDLNSIILIYNSNLEREGVLSEKNLE